MKYRLGIDLGTSSVGLAAYELDEENKIKKLAFLDSYIFGEPVDSEKKVTLNSQRRAKRLSRRQTQRKAARLRKLSYIAKSLGVSKTKLDAVSPDIHKLRAEAVDKEITIPELIKVFAHIIKNRGYKGDLHHAEGKVSKAIKQTKSMFGDYKTLGQVLYQKKLDANGQPWRKLEETGTFIGRKQVEDEFEIIWNEQIKYHPELNANYKVTYNNMFQDYKGKTEISLKDAFKSAMFYQRPIKWKLETVGKCPFEQGEYRASTLQPDFQLYRLADILSNIRIVNKKIKKDSGELLNCKDKNALFKYIVENTGEYNSKDEMPYSKCYALLKLHPDEKFSHDRARAGKEESGIKGITVFSTFEKLGVKKEFCGLCDKSRELIIEFLSNITQYSDVQENNDDYLKQQFEVKAEDQTKENKTLIGNVKDYAPENAKEAYDFIKLMKDKELFYKDEISELSANRAEYSVKALSKLHTKMLEPNHENNNIPYDRTQAENFLYPQEDKPLRSEMRSVDEVKIGDPVVDKSLREFKREIDYVIKKLGANPEEVVIELSRELKNSLAARQFIEKQNNEMQDARNEARTALIGIHIAPTGSNIERYLLWEEQGHECPYSGESISQLNAFSKATQVDHIIPIAGGGQNVYSNKALVMADYNRDKGDNTPYLSSLTNKPYKVDFDKVQTIADKFDEKAKAIKKVLVGSKYKSPINRRNLEQKAKNLRTKESIEELTDDFVNRQKNEIDWIGKIVLDWCKDICKNVSPAFGGLTSYLRLFGFDDVLPQVRMAEKLPLYDKDDNTINSEEYKIFKHLTPETFQLLLNELKNLGDNKTADEDKEKWQAVEKLKNRWEAFLKERKEDCNKKEIDKALLYQFKAEISKDYIYNKRCDHRHHAVDAAVIGLCNRSMIQAANTFNRKNGTLYSRDKYDDKNVKIGKTKAFMEDNSDIRVPLFKQLLSQVQQRLKDYTVWHKQDHYPDGEYFAATAYNIKENNGKKNFFKECTLDSFVDKKSNKESVINNLNYLLVGDTVKQEIIKQFEERIAKGMTVQEALCGKKGDPKDGIFFRGNKIKKVKAFYKNKFLIEFDADIDRCVSSKDLNGIEHKKYYQNSGYACMDFDAKTGKRLAIIPVWKYKQENKSAPENIIRIFSGDTLYCESDKTFYIVKSFIERDGLKLSLTTETLDNKITKAKGKTASLKGFTLLKTRGDLAKIKKQLSESKNAK